MTRGVALARKNLFQDRRRAALAIMGIGAALVLVLILDGVVAGAMRQVTVYIRHSPADVFVSQHNVRTMHMSQSVLLAATSDAVATVGGVAWAEGLRYAGSLIEVPSGGRRSTYVLGYDTATGRGGPRRFVRGRAPLTGEAVVDATAADELGVGVGDVVVALGERFHVSGLSSDGTSIANTTVYINTGDFARLRGPAIAYVLVGARPGVNAAQLARRIADAVPGVTAQTRSEFAGQEAKLVNDMSGDIMRVMTIIGFVISLAVVGLTLFSSTLGKLREYGIIKALGAGRARLTAIVLEQAAWSVGAGLILAVALALAAGTAIGVLTPNLDVVITASSIARTGIAALAIGALASLLPLRKVARVDPATSFRRA